LAFVDARCTLMIADAARRTIAAKSRQVTLRCLPEVAAGFTRIGLTDVHGIRLVASGDR